MNTLLNKAAVIGLTETDLLASSAGRWDRGAALRVRIESGALSSAPQSAILSGANVAAIGDGSAANWEVFQFATATLVGPKTYEINLRLRGQVGTDGIQPALWPIGSTFVLISAALQQIEMPLSARGLGRHYRFGPADRGYNSAATVLRVEAFDGIGLRPYAVVHLTAERQANSDLHIGWIRRSRVDGDSWQSWEVPLAETTEAYVLRVQSGANLLREVAVSAPAWTYTAAQQMSDAAVGTVTVAVAQVSQRFGPGPFRSIDVAL
jgi:hypothetical protein